MRSAAWNTTSSCFTLGFRFIYGMRTVTPIGISASRIRTHTFILLNIVSAAIWGPVMTGLGYAFGQILAPWLHGPKSIVLGLAGVAVLSMAVLAYITVSRRSARAA